MKNPRASFILGTTSIAGFAGVKLVPVLEPEKTLARKPRTTPALTGSSDEFDKLRLHFVELQTPAYDADLSNPVVKSKVAEEQAKAYFASAPCAAMVQQKDGKLSIAVADPTQKLTALQVEWSPGASSAIQVDSGVTVISLKPLKLSIDLTKTDGKTFQAEFKP